MTRQLFIIACLSLTSCLDSAPDYTPVGDGLKTIGFCLVCYAVVHVLGALVRNDKP